MKSIVGTLQETEFRNPGTTADLVVENEKEKILLVRRKNEPFKGYWALPGGFLEYGKETVELAGKRELEEEAGLVADLNSMKLIGIYSSPGRDPRGHIISHAYAVTKYSGIVKADDDAEEVGWFSKNSIPRLAFDHNRILRDYFSWKRGFGKSYDGKEKREKKYEEGSGK